MSDHDAPGGRTRTTDLERRYLRLLRAYPADYRRLRGAEIVGTYLDLAGPDRRWPSPADAADLVRGGLRQRLRAAGAADFVPGVQLAAVLAFLTAAALAAVWSVLELRPPAPEIGLPTIGPFKTIGMVAWAAWLVAAVGYTLAPGRYARPLLWVAVLLTALVVPVSALAGLARPPLFVLAPQLALGVVALGMPERPPLAARAAAITGSALAATLAARWFEGEYYFDSYRGFEVTSASVAASAVLLIVTLVLALGLAHRGDFRGGWALLFLATPLGLLSLKELAEEFFGRNPDWAALTATTLAVSLAGPALLLLAVAVRTRLAPLRAAKCCPNCGSPR
ncbi:hypothetical protein GA0074695_1883 [Micromonospora viridifaciens]|uniref:Uncharacterized protein n=1 Tax=Micromonospora viridifaciens TaxID=1881 RepID=A0A1C4VWZ9_MICVI|nr:hypothetical protein [Micromonospora viridifaciens]SCE88497.1 hypothetical protein GA0074695_1883 [Micromonospora viridifaciens]